MQHLLHTGHSSEIYSIKLLLNSMKGILFISFVYGENEEEKTSIVLQNLHIWYLAELELPAIRCRSVLLTPTVLLSHIYFINLLFHWYYISYTYVYTSNYFYNCLCGKKTKMFLAICIFSNYDTCESINL